MSSELSPFLERPDPPVTAETAEWWEGTRNHRLMLQLCDDCQATQFYPRSLCTTCGGGSLRLVPASGSGTIYSYTVVWRSPDPSRFSPPYAVALVRLVEGPTVLANIVGTSHTDVCCDQSVEVVWEDLPDGRALPLFKPTNQGV